MINHDLINQQSSERSFEHWHCELDSNHVLWARLDRKNASANTLNLEVMQELEHILEDINTNKNTRALIIGSGKSGFIAGADIEQFTLFNTPEEAAKLILYGQAVYNKLADLAIPTIALINGFCLGGGLELALSCRYRIIEDSPKTILGLPEVKLGIHPGWGGTIRLPKLIGIVKAMDLMLSGRTVRSKEAKKIGLVDAVVPKRLLNQVAQGFALHPPKQRTPTLLVNITNNPLIRRGLAWVFRAQLRKKIQAEHYPAPFQIIHNWEKWGVYDGRAMSEEAHSISRLLVSPTSKNLVHVFFLQEKLKSLVPKGSRKVTSVHVIGAGTMGGDIAGWCAIQGLQVTLQDQTPALLGGAVKRAYALASKRLKEKHLIRAAMDRLMPDPKGYGIAKADIIIEAITEKLEAKQNLFKALELAAKPDAILASNTSTIPIEEIASVLSNPQRLVGVHFFNPVAKMALVEIVQAQYSAEWVIKGAIAFTRAIDKLPLPVKSAPGFLVNRILLPYMLEAMILQEEGVALEAIDQAAVNFGMPVGPIELADIVGLDVCLAAATKLTQYYGGSVPTLLQNFVAQGRLGCKTGRGFYQYSKQGKLIKNKNTNNSAADHLIDRLILRMANEAVACLREGIVSEADLLDAGSIFGFGFAPFRGGLMQYIASQKDTLRKQLHDFESTYGQRFAPDAGWKED